MPGIEPDEPESIQEAVDRFLGLQRAAEIPASGRLTFAQAVTAFIASAPWIGPEHMPSITAIMATAEQLDRDAATGRPIAAALVAQYGLYYRDLRAQGAEIAGGPTPSPAGAVIDPVEAALRNAGK